MTSIDGVLLFHSETGTEGGYWAFQDEKFMGLDPPNHWRCPRCGRIWDKDRQASEPKPMFTYWRDMEGQISPEGHRYISGYAGYDEWHDDLPLAPPGESPDGLNATWTLQGNLANRECLDHGHERWESPRDRHPNGTWSYEGLHVLQDGDQLTVRYPAGHEHAGEIAWQGTIALHAVGLFKETASNMWIHADQAGEDRDTWARMFFEEWPAHLETPS